MYHLLFILTLPEACCECVHTPCCGTCTYFSHSHLICRWGRCEITVTSWYLENTFSKYLAEAEAAVVPSIIFLSIPRHINMPITMSQPCSAMMGFQNCYNQTCGMKSVTFCSVINYQTGRKLFHMFRGACIALNADSQQKIQRAKVQKTAIESTALIMQIRFI